MAVVLVPDVVCEGCENVGWWKMDDVPLESIISLFSCLVVPELVESGWRSSLVVKEGEKSGVVSAIIKKRPIILMSKSLFASVLTSLTNWTRKKRHRWHCQRTHNIRTFVFNLRYNWCRRHGVCRFARAAAMQTVLIVAEFLAGIRFRFGWREGLLCRWHIDRRNKVIATAILERWHALVLVVATATRAGTRKYQIIHYAWIAAWGCLKFG